MIFAFDMHVCTGFTELCYKLNITIHTAECPRRLDLCFRTAYGTILYISCTGSVFPGRPACSMVICICNRPGLNCCE